MGKARDGTRTHIIFHLPGQDLFLSHEADVKSTLLGARSPVEPDHSLCFCLEQPEEVTYQPLRTS